MSKTFENILWEKPEKAMSIEEWKSLSADGAPPGVYTPNMSVEDMLRWKGTIIKGSNPRVELRKTFNKQNYKPYPNNTNMFAQVLVIVSNKGLNDIHGCNVIMSMNGKCGMSFDELEEMQKVIEIGRIALSKIS
tara:strand:- start:2796 stop:3197 length:402 start_codon:yes stop_codon:yes gene_type:complete